MFKQHREKLRAALPQQLIVLTAYDELQLSGDMAAPYLQESSFWYLTGIEEQGWKLIFDTGSNQTWLVAPHVDAMHQVFDGALASEDAKKLSGVDAVIDETEFKQWLEELSKNMTPCALSVKIRISSTTAL